MHISAHDRQALVLSISATVRKAFATTFGTALPDDFEMPALSESLAKSLKKNLDRGGLLQFIETELHKMLLQDGLVLADRESVAVVDYPGFEDHVEVAMRLVDKLASLPWEYRIFVRGPRNLYPGPLKDPFHLQITDRLELISSESLRARYSFESEYEKVDDWIWQHSLRRGLRHFAPGQFYFGYRYSGYVAIASNGKATDELQYEMRAFYGACIAHRLMHPFGYHAESDHRLAFLGTKDGRVVEHSGFLDTDLQQATYFYPRLPVDKKFRSSRGLMAALSPAISLFNCATAQRLKTAAIWIFRAESGENPMDKVLESTIALEVLLGDRKVSDKIGLTRLMSNRCAYALGTSEQNREDIKSFFDKYYSLRSDIVHTGRLYLDEHEESLVERGLNLASEMLAFEQRLACA